MKKVLLTLTLFTVGALFTNVYANGRDNCVQSSIDAYDDTEESEDAYDNMVDAYDDCVRNGGSPGDTEVNI